MKQIARTAITALLSAFIAMAVITACGGNGGGGGAVGNTLARLSIFNANPVGRHANNGNVASRASIESPFVVNAQAPAATPGGGNFPGFCNTLGAVSGRAATVIFGIGRWSDGNCDDRATPDSDVGVAIPSNGQIGNVTVDAVGTGTDATSGQMEIKIIHVDGSETITPITCALGVSANTKVHCGDADATHHVSVIAGDQVSARIFWNPGDSYRAIRVNIAYATPTF